MKIGCSIIYVYEKMSAFIDGRLQYPAIRFCGEF